MPGPPASLQTALADCYRLEHALGAVVENWIEELRVKLKVKR